MIPSCENNSDNEYERKKKREEITNPFSRLQFEDIL